MIPRAFWLTRIITCTTALGLQGVGLYAALLAVVLQHIVSRRTSWSAGD